MGTTADTSLWLDQFGPNEATGALHALVRSHDLANAAYVAHTIPCRLPNNPIVWAHHAGDWLYDYVTQHLSRIDSIVAIEKTSLLPIDLDIVPGARGHQPKLVAPEIGTTQAQAQRALMVPVRGPLGDRSFLIVCPGDDDPDWDKNRRSLVPNLLLVAQCVHHYAMVKAGVYRMIESDIRLAPREAECLHWAAAGKTVEDIATILNISRRVTRAYLDGARHKLDASNITHAVARAISLGLVATD